jgi:hypothetical protein
MQFDVMHFAVAVCEEKPVFQPRNARLVRARDARYSRDDDHSVMRARHRSR